MTSVLIKETIYYGSYLAFPFLVACVLLLGRCVKRRKVFGIILLVGLIVVSEFFIWARFTEPDMLIVRRSSETKIGINKRVALIADMHLGVYNNSSILKKTVDKINNENVDAVLIAGDFTYHPKDLRKEFASLQNLSVPVYAILGNHDVEHPGPKIRDELEEVLRSYGVIIINNQAVDFGDGILVGLGDRWAEEDDVQYLDKVSKESDKPFIVLTHNPDTVTDYTADFYLKEKWVTLTGHTHCGQVRIPVLYKYAIPTEGEWHSGGYYDLGSGSNGSVNKLYITCGVGEVGLPLRLFNPPTVDILEL